MGLSWGGGHLQRSEEERGTMVLLPDSSFALDFISGGAMSLTMLTAAAGKPCSIAQLLLD